MGWRLVAHHESACFSGFQIPGVSAGTKARARVQGSGPEDSCLTVLTRVESTAVHVVVVKEAVETSAEDEYVLRTEDAKTPSHLTCWVAS